MLNKRNKKKLIVDWKEMTFLKIGVMEKGERENK